ncbi:MAG: tetratricopeptide repeat protein [Pseudomonadales bacterium]
MQGVSPVFEVTPQNFQTDVIERSREVPVILLFWAQQLPPSVEMRRQLETLTAQQGGRIRLGLVDVARDPTLAQHLRVQDLPALRIVQDGQLVHQADGPQSEAGLRALVDQLTQSPADVLRGMLDQLLESGDYQRALALVQQALQEEPNNQGFRVELADLLVLTGDLDQARQVLAVIPEDADQRARPQARLELVEEAAQLPSLEVLEAQLAERPDDLDLCYQSAVRLAAEGAFEPALERAMLIMQRDRTFRDDLGRLTMLRMFNALGKGSDLASRYRRRMFNFMH